MPSFLTRIFFHPSGNWHISDGSIEEIVLAGVVYVWWVLRTNPNLLANGLLEIQDMAGFKLKHARQVTVDLVKMGLKFHACVPPSATALAKGIVAFNSFALVEETYNLFKGMHGASQLTRGFATLAKF